MVEFTLGDKTVTYLVGLSIYKQPVPDPLKRNYCTGAAAAVAAAATAAAISPAVVDLSTAHAI